MSENTKKTSTSKQRSNSVDLTKNLEHKEIQMTKNKRNSTSTSSTHSSPPKKISNGKTVDELETEYKERYQQAIQQNNITKYKQVLTEFWMAMNDPPFDNLCQSYFYLEHHGSHIDNIANKLFDMELRKPRDNHYVLTGARGTGKSAFMKKLVACLSYLSSNITVITENALVIQGNKLSLFEYIRQELKTKNKPIHNSIKDFNQCLICIDEFQYFLEENKENNFDNIYIKELIPLLNNSNCCVILTGSASCMKKLITKNISQQIRKTTTYLTNYPIRNYNTFCQYLTFMKKDFESPETVYYHTGGLLKMVTDYPYAIKNREGLMKEHFFNDVYLHTMAILFAHRKKEGEADDFEKIQIGAIYDKLPKHLNIKKDEYINHLHDFSDKSLIYYDIGSYFFNNDGYVSVMCGVDFDIIKNYITIESDTTYWAAFFTFSGWENKPSSQVYLQHYFMEKLVLTDEIKNIDTLSHIKINVGESEKKFVSISSAKNKKTKSLEYLHLADKNNLCVPINWVDEQGIDALVLDFTHSTDKNPHVCKVTAFQVKLGLKDKEIGETPYNNMIRNFQIGWEKFKSLFPLDGCVYDLTHFFIVTTKVIFNDTKKSVYLVNEMNHKNRMNHKIDFPNAHQIEFIEGDILFGLFPKEIQDKLKKNNLSF